MTIEVWQVEMVRNSIITASPAGKGQQTASLQRVGKGPILVYSSNAIPAQGDALLIGDAVFNVMAVGHRIAKVKGGAVCGRVSIQVQLIGRLPEEEASADETEGEVTTARPDEAKE